MANEISFDVDPGYYLQPFTVNMLLAANVESLQYSVNGGAPSISKYIAYDTLTPPNPFIAVTQDGRGNVVYDGGFPKFYNSSAPNANIVPFDHAIRLQGERSAANVGTNSFVYCKLSDVRVDIVAGDKLVYDVWGNSAVVMAGVDGLINGLTATPLRHSGLVDQNSISCHPSTDITARAGGKWYRREILLTPLTEAGDVFIDSWQIALENEAAGVHVAYFKEIKVLNSSGQVKATLFSDTLAFPSGTLGSTGQAFFSNISTRNVDVRDQLTASYKYLFNALRFCENKTKVAAGNKKILIVGDASINIHANYRVKGANASDFATSFTRIAAIAGYTPTFKDGYDWSGSSGVINPTISELEQYCAVIFMSSVFQAAGAAYLITPEAIDAFLTYRENGNGLIFITDHGPIINTIGDAISSNKGGFFGTANAVITGFGAWFSGDYNRTPVNVGFLRSTYGDHPLYDSMLDSENIHAGASESRVNVASFESVAPSEVPPIPIPDGRTTIQVAAVLTTGEIVTYRAVYWVVNFKVSFTDGVVSKDNGQILDIGVKNKASISASIVGSLQENASGIVYCKGVRVGVLAYTLAGGSVITWDSGQNGTFQFNDGDEFKVVLSTPLVLTSAITIDRFQPSIQGKMNAADIMKTLRVWQPGLTDVKRMKKMVDDIAATYPALDVTYKVSMPANLKLIGQHFNNEGPGPVLTGLKRWWPFYTDASEQIGGLNGTLSGGAFFTVDAGRKCVRLPGNGKVNIPALGALGNTAWTFSTWYKPTALNVYHHLFTSVVNQGNFTLKLSPGGTIPAGTPYFNTAASGSLAASQAVAVNVWSMITYTYDGTALRIYINKTLVGTFTVALNIPNDAFVIGNGNGGAEWSAGYQSELLHYSRALSLAEIGKLYDQSV